jgi:hypothetical protein
MAISVTIWVSLVAKMLPDPPNFHAGADAGQGSDAASGRSAAGWSKLERSPGWVCGAKVKEMVLNRAVKRDVEDLHCLDEARVR